MEHLTELANNNDLDYVSTTSERSGYPRDIKEAITGFKNFKQAKEFADEHGLTPIKLHRKDGWDLYARHGEMSEGFRIGSEDYGNDYDNLSDYKNEEQFVEIEVQPCLENFTTLFKLSEFIKQKKEIWEEIENLEDGEIVITMHGVYLETIQSESMSWNHDTHQYLIGLIRL